MPERDVFKLSSATMREAGLPEDVLDQIGADAERTQNSLKNVLARHVSPAFLRPLVRAVWSGKAKSLDGATMIDDIAVGGTGHVRIGWEWSLGRAVAKKLVSDERITARREFNKLLQVNDTCPDVAPAVLAIDGTERILTTEYCDGMDLSHLVSAGFRRRIAFTVAALARAADKLHRIHRKARIAHRDVKPSNLLWEMAKETLYVGDFGNSNDISQGDMVMSDPDAVTPHYCAPEDVMDRRRLDGRKADVFSLGMTGYALGTGEVPYADDVTVAGMVGRKGIVGVPEHIERVRDELGSALGDLLARMMATDPSQRPDMEYCTRVLRAWDRQLNQRLYGPADDGARFRFPVDSGGDPLQSYRQKNHMRINPAKAIEALDEMYPAFQPNRAYVLPDPPAS